MNVRRIPNASDRINEVRALTAQIVNREILPNENLIWAEARGTRLDEADRAQAGKARDRVKDVVRQAGLWAPHLPAEYGGAGLDFLELAYMYEVLSYATGAAALFGVVAPNSGNQKILIQYGTEEQKRAWLQPLIEGTMESGFSMTEPDQPLPVDNALGERGTGHQAAQDRLGAGRVYHCMNSIGAMWRAFDLMVQRATEREVHGGLLESKQMIQQFIADSYIDIQSARLMTIDCAEKMAAGQDARTDISAIKIAVPAAFHRVVDRAIQVWGAAGVTGDLPLQAMYTGARTLRLADGPDEVHKILIAKNVLGQYRDSEYGWDFGG